MEDDHYETRKERKAQRKIASKTDRSKFKKTDREKWEKSLRAERSQKLSKRDLVEGRVLSIGPEGISVQAEGQTTLCVLSGLLKREVTRTDTLVTVGDHVLFDRESGLLLEVLPRRSVLARTRAFNELRQQILAANVDQVLITVCLGEPYLKVPLIDRYIIAAMQGGMAPLLVVNKIELLSEVSPEEQALFKALETLYPPLGVPVIGVSAKSGSGLEKLRAVMKDKSSVFAGQSGVGKSSLINAMTGLDLAVGELAKSRKGAHTTTRAHLIPLAEGGFCVDTPGIKSFGLVDLTREDLKAFFSEIDALGVDCKYPNCTHHQEPHCAVQRALQEGKLHPLRLSSYLKLLEEL